MTYTSLRNIFLASRPKTLPAIIVPVSAGCMIVWKYQDQIDVSINMLLAICTMVSAICIQIACNFFNDSIDSIKKADTAQRQGPRRITASGAMSARTVQLWGLGFLAIAALAALPLIEARGLIMLAIGIPSMFLAYGYTGGPWPLAYKGLGELFVLLFFGLVAVVGCLFVQVGWQPDYAMMYGAAVIIGLQCGLLSCLLIEINNIRDRKEDAQTGKTTLAVRIGDKRARGLAFAFIIAPYVILHQTDFFLPGMSMSAIWLAPILVALLIILRLRRCPANKRMNALLALASLHLVLFLAAISFS